MLLRVLYCAKKPHDRQSGIKFVRLWVRDTYQWNNPRRGIANSNHTNCAKRSVKNEENKTKKNILRSRCAIVCQRNAAALLAEITRSRDTDGCLRSCRNESFVPLLITTGMLPERNLRKSCQLESAVVVWRITRR